MTCAFRDSTCAAACPCSKSAESRPLVDRNGTYKKFINVCSLVVFRICYCRLQHFHQQECRLGFTERQYLHCPLHGQSSKLVGNESRLLRRKACVSQCRGYLHQSRSQHLFLGFAISGMPAKRASRCKLAQFMSHHVLGYEDWYMLPPIVNGNCKSNHVRNYHRPSRPRSDWSPTVRRTGCLYLPKKVMVDKGPFLDRAWHEGGSLYLRGFLRRMIIRDVLLFRRVLWPLVGTPHGVTGCRPPEERPSPPPCG